MTQHCFYPKHDSILVEQQDQHKCDPKPYNNHCTIYIKIASFLSVNSDRLDQYQPHNIDMPNVVLKVGCLAVIRYIGLNPLESRLMGEAQKELR